MDFEIKIDHLISAWWPDLILVNKKKKRTCRIVDFAILVDPKVKLKESEKRDKHLDPARKLKKLWNMKVTMISVVIGVLSKVTKGLVQGLESLNL